LCVCSQIRGFNLLSTKCSRSDLVFRFKHIDVSNANSCVCSCSDIHIRFYKYDDLQGDPDPCETKLIIHRFPTQDVLPSILSISLYQTNKDNLRSYHSGGTSQRQAWIYAQNAALNSYAREQRKPRIQRNTKYRWQHAPVASVRTAAEEVPI
jgi:hypothetical protein